MVDNLYKEEILEHYRDPQNFGEVTNATASSKQTNPLCGDDIAISLKSSGEKIEDIRFQGKGCAISIAAASLLTEYVKGKELTQLTKFSENDMLQLLGVEISETRKKCALLAYAVLHDCITQ